MVKFIFGVLLLLSVLVYASRQGPLFKQVMAIPLPLIVEICSLYLISQVLSAYKWKLILDSLNERKPFFDCLKAYFLGMYINSFGLGIVGGDVVRALTIDANSKRVAILSVLFDRLHGFLVLATLGGISGFILLPEVKNLYYLLVPMLQLSISVVGFLIVFLSFYLTRVSFFQRWSNILDAFAFTSSLSWRNLLWLSFLSAIFHVIQIFSLVIYAAEFDINVSYFDWLAVMPLVNIASSLPISWNGVGIRESLLILYLTPNPFSITQVVTYSLIWLFAVIFGSILGAVIAIFGNFNFKLKS
ncbi:MAG: flippase-like domain-containing protein [Deltaproteobacteria bacterium]|nr:flippase-like domain-containing protein [Deltaproteobacteria bacterium]